MRCALRGATVSALPHFGFPWRPPGAHLQAHTGRLSGQLHAIPQPPPHRHQRRMPMVAQQAGHGQRRTAEQRAVVVGLVGPHRVDEDQGMGYAAADAGAGETTDSDKTDLR